VPCACPGRPQGYAPTKPVLFFQFVENENETMVNRLEEASLSGGFFLTKKGA
jgi:hypothetical protein